MKCSLSTEQNWNSREEFGPTSGSNNSSDQYNYRFLVTSRGQKYEERLYFILKWTKTFLRLLCWYKHRENKVQVEKYLIINLFKCDFRTPVKIKMSVGSCLLQPAHMTRIRFTPTSYWNWFTPCVSEAWNSVYTWLINWWTYSNPSSSSTLVLQVPAGWIQVCFSTAW